MRRVSRLTAFVLLALFQAALASSQSATATLTGRVRDAQGAAVPGATVSVAGRGTGVARRTTTGPDGTFVVPGLPPGTVDVSVTASGAADVDADRCSAGGRPGGRARHRDAREDGHRNGRRRVVRDPGRYDTLGRGRGHRLAAHRGASAERAELPRAVAARARQRAGPELRPDQEQHRHDLVGRAARTRRQRHHRRRRQQRRRGRRPAAERDAGLGRRNSRSPPTASAPRSGRSGSSVINVVTKSGTDQLRGSASLYAARLSWQALPATYDRRSGRRPALRPAAVRGGRRRPARLAIGCSGSGPFEYRNQDGAVLVGTRDAATRTIRRSFAPAPLDDLLGIGAGGLAPERARHASCCATRASAPTDTGASTLDRADRLGLAAADQPQPLPLRRRHLDADVHAARR